MTRRLTRMTIGGLPRVVDLFRVKPTFPHLNVTAFGATGNGSTNDQAAIVAGIAAAKAQHLPLYFPSGTYLHSGRLTVDGVTLFGLAPSIAVLRGTTVAAHALDLTGTAPQLHNLGIRGPGKSPRTSDRGGNGIYINACTGYVVRNCHVRDVSGAGMMTEDGHGGLIRNNLVETTGADGIYQTEGTTNLEVAYNKTVATGDDALSVTSYATALGFCSNVVFHHNTVVGNWESRAVSVNGCNGGIVVRDNHIDGGTSGVSVTSVTEWGTLQSIGVEVYGNTIRNINRERQDAGTIGGGAFSFWNDVGGTDSGISMHDNRVFNPGLYGIYAGGSSPITASVSGNTFHIETGRTLYSASNGAATITRTGNTTGVPNAYPGDLVPRSVGGIDLAYRYTP